MKIKVLKKFCFAHGGIKLIEYSPGIHVVSKRCAEVACAEGWAKKMLLQTKRKSKNDKSKL